MDDLLTIETLNEEHVEQLQNFKCEDEPEVEDYLKEKAMIYHLGNLARTRLFFDENHNLIGYFSVFNDHVFIGKDKSKKENLVAPSGEKFFPAIRLHYLGVDSRYRGKRYGEQILMAVFEHCYKVSLISGSSLITVQALNSSIGFYAKNDFVMWKHEAANYLDMFFAIHNLQGLLDEEYEKEFLDNFF
ncbi:GNAT family N-acetyltransferase [Bacillus sp. RIT694]|uniref:GNAT family N-acetyltransferase n=1 Tax=Bacillus sp. RIT694 TaxID=2666190 RepID=UPI0012ACE66F|nr:GNAT family N-acetyltransferase [Bacillus sp. RIT694]MRS25826.1 N-acetyltransferase [Bacillus sp. RIT694]